MFFYNIVTYYKYIFMFQTFQWDFSVNITDTFFKLIFKIFFLLILQWMVFYLQVEDFPTEGKSV